MTLFKTVKYDIVVHSETLKTLLISAYDYKLCNKLNGILEKYKGYKFLPYEEAMFVVNMNDFSKIKGTISKHPGSLTSVENWLEKGY